MSRNSLIRKERSLQQGKVFPNNISTKNEENDSDARIIKQNKSRNKLFNDLNSIFAKDENYNILKYPYPILDSLLNTHKNFVVLINTKEFYEGTNILELKKKAFLEKFNAFIRKKVSLPRLDKKSIEKVVATTTLDPMLITNISELEVIKKNKIKENEMTTEVTYPNMEYNVISTLATENSDYEIKSKTIEHKGKEVKESNCFEFKLPKIKVRILDHTNLPKIKNASLLNPLEIEKLNAYCKLKKNFKS